MDYDALLVDPRPELPDSRYWTMLLRKTVQLPDKRKAEALIRSLWTVRDVGTSICITETGPRLEPILEPVGRWANKEDFDHVRRNVLAPYGTEIASLLRKVVEEG